jgi:hypothetical protein
MRPVICIWPVFLLKRQKHDRYPRACGKEFSMTTRQFAEISKDLYQEIHFIESLLKSNVFKEADGRLSGAKKTCKNLDALVEPENAIQRKIVTNRQTEILWLETAVKIGLAKTTKPAAKKRTVK